MTPRLNPLLRLTVSNITLRRAALGVAVLLAAGAVTTPARADDEKPEAKKDAPAVRAVAPLAVASGETVTVRLRGFLLDDATEVRVAGPGAPGLKVDLKNKGKAEGDDTAKKKAGDTQVEIELTLPKEPLAGDRLELVVVTPKGEAPVATLRVLPPDRLVTEAEPNGGLRKSQAVPRTPSTVRGAIGEEKDVDVYRVTGKAGQTLRAEIVGERAGSMLDARLAIYDMRGGVYGTADDDTAANSRDPIVTLKLPADGDYVVAVNDANDRGGASTHAYLLELSLE